jgi:hypothetical protein
MSNRDSRRAGPSVKHPPLSSGVKSPGPNVQPVQHPPQVPAPSKPPSRGHGPGAHPNFGGGTIPAPLRRPGARNR